MKKFLTIASISLAAFACQRKTAPAAPPPPPEPSAAEVAHAEMVKAGAVIYSGPCTRCHGAAPLDKFTADQWTAILKRMIPKAKLDATQASQVTAYVMEGAKK